MGKLELRTNDEAFVELSQKFQALSKLFTNAWIKLRMSILPTLGMLLSHPIQYGMKTLKIDGASNSSDIETSKGNCTISPISDLLRIGQLALQFLYLKDEGVSTVR
jgi:hypothetical protein